jgi:hypothetical protein
MKKRPLTMRMAWKLYREWNIPAEALIAPPRTRGRKSAAQNRRNSAAIAFAEVARSDRFKSGS